MNGLGLSLEAGSIAAISMVAFIYLIAITVFGSYFSRFNRNINDFFYSGNRFSWWLPAASMIATGIGSYSYLKYSEQGYLTGMSSTTTYLNDWFLAPFFLFGWLPIIYYSRIKSVPEYFERRFNRTAKHIALVILMSYMLFYIGYNLYTIGVALEGMFQLPQSLSVPLLAVFLGVYVTYGGQTAVIFTDLAQGILLYLAGFLAIFAGLSALGGFAEWWAYLPLTHRLPFVHLNESPQFNSAGLFWGEALAGSIAYAFMNQGFLMRFLTIKSVHEGRKAAFFNVIVTLPISAVIVGAVGWIGKAILVKQQSQGHPLPGMEWIHIENSFHTFVIICWATVEQNPWLFGFIVAALLAALMSTIDTLINACAAIAIYDLYQPLIKPQATDTHYLKAARWASIITTLLGLLLVVWFNQQSGSLMSIHYKGILIIIPAIVTNLLLGVFWPRYTATAACTSMILGSLITVLSVWNPDWIQPLSEYLMGPRNGGDIYFRALFGMLISGLIGFVVTLLSRSAWKDVSGLTIDTIETAMRNYKGGRPPNHAHGEVCKDLVPTFSPKVPIDFVHLSPATMKRLAAQEGDLVYLSDQRWWLGGLRSRHVTCCLDRHLAESEVLLSPETFRNGYFLDGKTLSVEKII